MSKNEIKVLIVDDSLVISKLLYALLSEDKDFRVVGCAKDGLEAVEMTKSLKPDIITMDVEMPKLNGLEATKKIMSEYPTPIVMITSHVNTTVFDVTFDALNAGALTVIKKPSDVLSAGFERQKKDLLNTLRALSEVHVIRRREQITISHTLVSERSKTLELLVLGASTGGPQTLCSILSELPVDFPVPIAIVQHISEGFLTGLVNWLATKTPLKVEAIQKTQQPLYPGTIYFAPDHYHLTIEKGDTPIAVLEDSEPIKHCKPSVTRLFQSVAQNYPNRAMAGLLTGMGKDGGEGLLAMKTAHCRTFIQNESSCVVFGMPGFAKSLGAQEDILDLSNISDFLIKTFKQEK